MASTPAAGSALVAIGVQTAKSVDTWMTYLANGAPANVKENPPPANRCGFDIAGGAAVLTATKLVAKARRPSGH